MEDRVMDRQIWEAKVMTTNVIELSRFTAPLGIDNEPPPLPRIQTPCHSMSRYPLPNISHATVKKRQTKCLALFPALKLTVPKQLKLIFISVTIFVITLVHGRVFI
jgi:hypothetical protein